MKKISFNEGTLGFDKNQVTYEIPLEKTSLHSEEEVQFIKNVPHMFPVTDLKINENKTFFSMEFEVESGFLPLSAFKSNSTDEQKYNFIASLCEVMKDLQNYEKIVTVLDDKNILVKPETSEVKFIYRGIRNLMPAASYVEDSIEEQVKRVSLFVLTSAKFDEIRINGLDIALNKTNAERYKLVSKIHQADTLNAVVAHIKGLQEENQKVEDTKQSKSSKSIKSIFSSFKNNMEGKINKVKDAKPERKLIKERKIVKQSIPETKKGIEESLADHNLNTKRVVQADSMKPGRNILFLNTSKFKVIAGTIIASVLIVFTVYSFSDNKNSETASVTLANSEEDNDFLLKGLQYAAVQDYEKAIENFEKIKTSFGELRKENQNAILFAYLMNGQYQEAINTEPRFAYSVINYLVSKDNLSAINNIDSDESVILFEKAAMNEEYESVLKYKDEIRLDGRRESLVVDAFIVLEKYDDGLEFARMKGNTDLVAKIEAAIEKAENQKNQKEKAKEQKQKQEPKKPSEKEESRTV